MKTVYIADDGKKFENEYECCNYEFGISHPHLKTIELYDRHGKKLTNPLDDETYFNFTKIIIHSEEELTDLYDAADYTGFTGYYDIKSGGTWVFDQDKEKFVKYVNLAFNQELSDKYVDGLDGYGFESNHEYADDMLCQLLLELGYEDVVEAYKKVPKWYS
jgi:frataxin-like iron-binding protein CyaY